MHRKTLILLLCCGALLLVAACSSGDGNNAAQQQAGTNNNQQGAGKVGGQRTDDGIVRASAGEVALRAGAEAEAEVRLDIQDGYHVNANPPTDKNLIGTQLSVAPGDGGLSAGEPVYPKALMRKFEFDERELAVYEGQPVIKIKLRADASAAKGRQTLAAKVRVQPCNDRECLPPRNIETAIPVNVN